MVLTAVGLNVPAQTDSFDPATDFVDLATSLQGRIVVPVANATERDALAVATPGTPARPLFVYRADTDMIERSVGGAWQFVWWPTMHAELTSPADWGVPNATLWGAGVQSIDATQTIGTAVSVTSESFRVAVAGIWAVSAFIRYDTAVGGTRALLSLEKAGSPSTVMARSIYTGDDNGTLAVPNVRLVTGQNYSITFYQNSGATRVLKEVRTRVTLVRPT